MKMKNKVIIGLLIAIHCGGMPLKGKRYNPGIAPHRRGANVSFNYYLKSLNLTPTEFNALFEEALRTSSPEIQARYKELSQHHSENAVQKGLLFETGLVDDYLKTHPQKNSTDEKKLLPAPPAPKESALKAEYQAYVAANANPYAAAYQQKNAQLETLRRQLALLKKNTPTNTHAIKELEEKILFLNEYDPGRDMLLRPIMSFDEWKKYRFMW
jgi:hypothetical protein